MTPAKNVSYRGLISPYLRQPGSRLCRSQPYSVPALTVHLPSHVLPSHPSIPEYHSQLWTVTPCYRELELSSMPPHYQLIFMLLTITVPPRGQQVTFNSLVGLPMTAMVSTKLPCWGLVKGTNVPSPALSGQGRTLCFNLLPDYKFNHAL